MSNPVYFAADKDIKCAGVLLQKMNVWTSILEANGFLDKLRMAWAAYHGAYYTDISSGHQITFSGTAGEITNLPVNHLRNIAQHILVMTCASRPIMQARATNTDAKSLSQSYLANGLLDYYMREKRMENYLHRAVEYAIVMGAGFIKMAWNATTGQMYDFNEETNTPIYEGDVEFVNLSPLDVITDNTKEDVTLVDWYLTRTWKNRFDVAAKWPEFEDKIMAVPTKVDALRYRFNMVSLDETDDIAIYEFFHKRTESLPDGRYMMFVTDDCVLQDTPMPYRSLPIYRISPADIMGTPHGYSSVFDLMPLQEALNSLYSTVLSNQNAFGVQNILVPRGADISIGELTGGLNIIECNFALGKPEALNLTNTPPEVFKFIDIIKNDMETISGVNSVARGNPDASLKSGNALALVQSMALQFASGLQQSYVELIEDVGTGLINMLRDYAAVPRIAAIVGKGNRTFMKEFKGDDLANVNRVVVEVGNPLSRCLAKDTPILMYDGSIKVVQDIKQDDQIMGPDSGPRTVESTASGQEMMYEITSKDVNRNIKYGCNESHILTLKYCSDDYRYDCKQGDILDISVKDYLKLTFRQKRLLQGFTTGVEFEEKKLPIPPYILGAWLGDGTSATTALTSMDKELVEEWTNYATSLGLKIRIQENRQPNKSKIYFITSGESHGKSDRNSFMNDLRELELINNKHIPNIYLYNDKKSRLELLAGLLDTDGHRIDETFIFTQKNKVLVDNVEYLAKSLGFRVTVKQFKANSSKLVGEIDSQCFKISIGGDTWEIPTRLPRKKARQKDKARHPLNYGINVECKGEGTYYGFTLKEEPHFLLGDFTVTHNTTAGRVQMAEQMLQMGAIKDPQQYFTVMNTGNLDVMTEGTQWQMLLIKDENESMMKGESVAVIDIDDHKNHIIEHSSILASQDLRKNPDLVKMVLGHIQLHIESLQQTDPNLLKLLGQNPLQPDQASPQGPPTPMSGSPQPKVGPPTFNPHNMPGPSTTNPNSPQGQGLPTPPPVQGSPNQSLPSLPKVPSNLLPNSASQQSNLGNVGNR